MNTIKPSYHGRARKTAHALWKGSDYMLNQADDHSWSGFCVLRLAMRQETATGHEIEARAAYASLADKTEQNAILRAVYWDSRTLAGKSREDTGPIKVPARFVQIPISLVHQWLRAFDAVLTSIRVFAHSDDNSPICSLRIETNYVDSAFEKVWQALPGERDELTRVWLDRWHDMGKALQTYSAITGIEESFPCVEGKPEAYDFQAYEPLMTLS